MSDTKPLNLSSLVSKKTRRAKERLLQNFGKADRTTDELFEVYQLNFNRQHSTALNLQKHVKNYLACLRELHEASKALSSCLVDMHEKDWPKHETYENNLYESEHINDELEDKIKEGVLEPLEQYLGQFAEVREKISKRGRKLVDYDSQRHSFESLQQSQLGRQTDDSKLTKQRDQLEEAKRVYETLNHELHDELPALYDNRLSFIITVFQRIFCAHVNYHGDNINLNKKYLESIEQLAKATERGVLNTIRSIGDYQTQVSSSTSGPNKEKSKRLGHHLESTNGTNRYPDSSPLPVTAAVTKNYAKETVQLHRVKATYPYLAEDEDELTFEAGEIIRVIEYDDPTEQEEGWLMGIKETDGKKGLFPANFTKPLES